MSPSRHSPLAHRRTLAGVLLGALVLVSVMVSVIAGCSGETQDGVTPTAGGRSTTERGSGATISSATTGPPSTPTEPRTPPAGEDDLRVEVVAEGLEVPWEIRVLPDGRLLVTERPGRLVRVDPATGAVDVLGELAVADQGEGGLLGLALDPDFPSQPYVYVAYTRDSGSGLANRVSRLTLTGDRAEDEKVLVDGIPAAGIHNGSRLGFGPDGALWVTTGDAGQAELAQDPGSLAGKVLRMDREGRPAKGNPVAGSLVYSLGHRNPQGLAWLPGEPEPFVTEHGPSDNDEINHLQPGANFGWPIVRGTGGGGEFADPLASWTPTIAPAGAVFYDADAIPGWKGPLLFVTLKESDLRRLVPDDAGFTSVAEEQTLFDGRFGRLRSIAVGPNGEVYVGTSNRDGRGDADPADDRILRISPK